MGFVNSHGIESPAFQSRKQGFFWYNGAELGAAPYIYEDLQLFGITLRRFAIHSEGGGLYRLALEFLSAVSIDEAEEFVSCFADAFTVSMAGGQRDAWYGNLTLKPILLGLIDSTPQPPNSFAPRIIGTGMTSGDFIPIADTSLLKLTWSPLTKLFAEGMRAAQPKSKFLFWFVIVEEREGLKEFRKLFSPLFSPEEKEVLAGAALSPAAKKRLSNLINDPKATTQGRAEKLLAIFSAIGVRSIKTLDGERVFDEQICRSLIDQRNNIAHKGSSIDLDELYTVLFPLHRLRLATFQKFDYAFEETPLIARKSAHPQPNPPGG